MASMNLFENKNEVYPGKSWSVLPGYDSHPFDSTEPYPPIWIVESLLNDSPENIRAHWKGDAMQQQWHTSRSDVRMFGVAVIPQTKMDLGSIQLIDGTRYIDGDSLFDQ